MKKSTHLAKILRIPCHAHSAQLIANDIINGDVDLQDARTKSRKFRVEVLFDSKHQVRLPAANETRWSSDERLMAAILRDREKKEPRISQTLHDTLDITQLQHFTNTLRPIREYTNLVQRDDATLFEAIAGLQLLLSAGTPVAEATEIRITSTFLCDATFLFCFFSPCFNLKKFLKDDDAADEEDTMADLSSCVQAALESQAISNLCSQIGIETLDLITEIGLKSRDSPLKARMTEFYSLYGKFHAPALDANYHRKLFSVGTSIYKQTFPNWSKLMLALSSMLPTEASCERVFSILKKIITPEKSRMSEENAAALCEIRMLLSNEKSILAQLEKTAEEKFEEIVDQTSVKISILV